MGGYHGYGLSLRGCCLGVLGGNYHSHRPVSPRHAATDEHTARLGKLATGCIGPLDESIGLPVCVSTQVADG